MRPALAAERSLSLLGYARSRLTEPKVQGII